MVHAQGPITTPSALANLLRTDEDSVLDSKVIYAFGRKPGARR
ncbi:hypothetical protein [Amycolatopsis decaplanina]|nr:hypothetical protein [Amycolatopsis decaplanina]